VHSKGSHLQQREAVFQTGGRIGTPRSMPRSPHTASHAGGASSGVPSLQAGRGCRWRTGPSPEEDVREFGDKRQMAHAVQRLGCVVSNLEDRQGHHLRKQKGI